MTRAIRLCAAVVAAALAASWARGAPADVVVVKSRPLAAYDAAEKGFLSVMGGQVGVSATYALTGDPELARRVRSRIRSEPPDLVLALGTEAAKQVGAGLGDVPVVFAMVVDPVQSDLVSNPARPGGNITGVSLAVSPADTLGALKQAVPSAKRMGIIYDPSHSQHAVQEMIAAARAAGMQVITRAVHSAAEVPRAAEELRHKMDVLYAPVDGTVYSPQSAKFVLLFALRSSIPVVGFSPNMAQAGALLAVYPDYVDVGRQAGYLAQRILAGAQVGSIPVAAPRKSLLAVNLNVARTLGLTIRQSLTKTADEVYR